MKPMIFFTRVLPVSFFTAILLFNFQNCAKPTALTSTGQTVASNPSTSTGGGSSPTDVFQPSTPTPNGGGGLVPPGTPNCLRIENVRDLAEIDPNTNPNEILEVKVVALAIVWDRFAKGGMGAWKTFTFKYAKSQIILTHEDGNSFAYNFETSDPKVAVQSGSFFIPKNIYLGVVGRPQGIKGFFTSSSVFSDDAVRFENLNLPYCNR